jgi:hypothetical protein
VILTGDECNPKANTDGANCCIFMIPWELWEGKMKILA